MAYDTSSRMVLDNDVDVCVCVCVCSSLTFCFAYYITGHRSLPGNGVYGSLIFSLI